jgi:hypothetical protein
MARDCFVHWDTTQSVPSKEDLQLALEEYVSGIAVRTQWLETRKRFIVELPGLFERDNQAERRWFEVFRVKFDEGYAAWVLDQHLELWNG